MDIIRYGIAFILTLLMISVDVVIILICGAVALYDGIVNRNWNFKSLWEYVKGRLDNYVEYWDIFVK